MASTIPTVFIEHLNHTMAEASQRLEACIDRFCEQQEVWLNTLMDDQLRYQQEVFDVILDRNSVFSDGFLSDEIKFVNVVEKPVFASLDDENSGDEESVLSKPFVTNPNKKISEDVGKLDKDDKGIVMEADLAESKDVGLGNSGIKEAQWSVFNTDVLQNSFNDSEFLGEFGDGGKIEEILVCDNSSDNKVSTMPARLMFDDSSGRDERLSKANQNRNMPIKRIENEYGPQGKNIGAAGHNYMTWVAKLVVGLDTGVPWVMCKEEDAPDVVRNTCNGFYCDNFHVVRNTCNGFYCDNVSPNRSYKPTIWTEAWSGWFMEFGGSIHNRPVQNLAFAVARFIKKGRSFVNYYKYHGGTNLGHSVGGSFITTSYDYEAPLDEYGLIRHPKYGQLKELPRAIKLCEHALVSTDPIVTSLGSSQQAHVFSSENGNCAAFLAISDTKSAARVMFSNMHYKLPLWSINNLSDCRNAVFNTVNIGVQASKMRMLLISAYMTSWGTYNEDLTSLDDIFTFTTFDKIEESLASESNVIYNSEEHKSVYLNISQSYGKYQEGQVNAVEAVYNADVQGGLPAESHDITCHILRIVVKCLPYELSRKQWRPGISIRNQSGQFRGKTEMTQGIMLLEYSASSIPGLISDDFPSSAERPQSKNDTEKEAQTSPLNISESKFTVNNQIIESSARGSCVVVSMVSEDIFKGQCCQRVKHPRVAAYLETFENILARLDKAERALCFSSGMATLVTATHLVGTDEIVAGNDMYDGSDRLSKIARKGLIEAKKKNVDVVIIDTTRRLQIDKDLIDELKEVKRELNTTEVLLVVDVMTGQEAATLVTTFNLEIGITEENILSAAYIARLLNTRYVFQQETFDHSHYEAMGEEVETVAQKFPGFDLEDKVVLWERGIVMDWPNSHMPREA